MPVKPKHPDADIFRFLDEYFAAEKKLAAVHVIRNALGGSDSRLLRLRNQFAEQRGLRDKPSPPPSLDLEALHAGIEDLSIRLGSIEKLLASKAPAPAPSYKVNLSDVEDKLAQLEKLSGEILGRIHEPPAVDDEHQKLARKLPALLKACISQLARFLAAPARPAAGHPKRKRRKTRTRRSTATIKARRNKPRSAPHSKRKSRAQLRRKPARRPSSSGHRPKKQASRSRRFSKAATRRRKLHRSPRRVPTTRTKRKAKRR